MSPEPILSIKDLTVEFDTEDGVVHAVTDVSYDLFPGEVLGVIGESGSGKSVSVMSVLGLVPQGRIVSGTAIYKGDRDLLTLAKDELQQLRGGEVSMIFQDPMTSLNPVFSVGFQIAEAIRTHNDGVGEDEAKRRAVGLLSLVGVPNPEARYDQYPHEFSGGMRQRGMIAMAIANSPSVLDRRRADDSARCDDSGSDHRGAADSPARDARRHDPHHARPRRDRRARGPRRDHVCGQGRRTR